MDGTRIIFFSVLLLISACGSQPSIPGDHFYRLPDILIEENPGFHLDGIIYIEPLIAEGIYHDRAIIYSDDSSAIELKQYHYHYWIDSPSRLIRDYVTDYFKLSGFATQVVNTPDIPAQISIIGRIRHFEIQKTSSGKSAVVSLEFKITSPLHDAPVLMKNYSKNVKIQGVSMSESVKAFGGALTIIMRDLSGDIKHNL